MKKSILFVAGIAILAILVFVIIEKNREAVNLTPLVKLIPQQDNTACWAASIAMVYNTINDKNSTNNCDNLQCEIITYNHIDDGKTKHCGCPKCYTSSQKSIDQLKPIISYFIPEYSKIDIGKTMLLNSIKTLIIDKKKPIIYDFIYKGDGTKHLSVISGIERQEASQNNFITLMKITDPFPVCKGNEYYMTYERYFYQDGVNSSTSSIGKYTIHPELNTLETHEDSLNNNKYITNVFYNNSEKELINNFIEVAKSNNTLSEDFFKITTLPNHFENIKVGLSLKIKNIGTDEISIISSSEIAEKLKYLRNTKYNEKLICLIKNCTIQTTITTSNIGTENAKKWIIYSIEKGKEVNAFAKAISPDTGKRNIACDELFGESENFVIYLKDKDAHFIVFNDADKNTIDWDKLENWKVFDLYGIGFQALDSSTTSQILSFNDFLNLKYFQTIP